MTTEADDIRGTPDGGDPRVKPRWVRNSAPCRKIALDA